MTDTAAFWDKIARKYAATPIKDVKGYEATLARTAHYLGAADSVLEVGCGTGSTALRLAPIVGHILATDVSAGMIEIAQEKKADTPNVTFRVSALDDLPDDRFDAILGFNLYHLVPDLALQVRRAHARLRPGGLFITKTPCMGDASWIFRPLVALMRLVGKAPYVNYFTHDDLERALRDGGFEILEQDTSRGAVPRSYIVARRP